jgi:hypothetical protein
MDAMQSWRAYVVATYQAWRARRRDAAYGEQTRTCGTQESATREPATGAASTRAASTHNGATLKPSSDEAISHEAISHEAISRMAATHEPTSREPTAHRQTQARGRRELPRWRYRLSPLLRWARRTVMIGTIALTLAALLLAVLLTTTGVLATRDGDWVVQVPLLSRGRLQLSVPINVAGALRFATTPLGARLLNGRAVTTRYGHLAFARHDRTLAVRCAPCRIDDARIAAQAVALPALELRLTPRTDALDTAPLDGSVSGGGIAVSFLATLRRDGIDVQWSLPATDIARVAHALADAVPEARRAHISGTVQGSGKLALPAQSGRAHVQVDDFAVAGLGTESLRFGRFDHLCAGGDAPLHRTSGEGTADWMALDALGRWLAPAVIAAEDQRFYTHAGFDEIELDALLGPVTGAQFRTSGARGASTITQQLARTIYTGGARNLARKLRETLYAVEMERTLGKPRILELYLNTAHWGPSVCGAKQAARLYFNRAPQRLTAVQAAWLAGILPQPQRAYTAQYVAQAPDSARAGWVLMQMRELPRRERERLGRQPLGLEVPALH